jgi:hypothetical protein
MQENLRALYGGNVLLSGNAEVTILGFNDQGNPVTAHVPIHKLLNVITPLSKNFGGITKTSAIYFYTHERNVLWMVVDDKMKVVHDSIPLEGCWTAIETIGKFHPVNVHQAA